MVNKDWQRYSVHAEMLWRTSRTSPPRATAAYVISLFAANRTRLVLLLVITHPGSYLDDCPVLFNVTVLGHQPMMTVWSRITKHSLRIPGSDHDTPLTLAAGQSCTLHVVSGKYRRPYRIVRSFGNRDRYMRSSQSTRITHVLLIL